MVIRKLIDCGVVPPAGWIKINTDATCVMNTGQMGIGCVIRDDQSCFPRARSEAFQGRLQPREFEGIELREALPWTMKWRRNKCVFECDAKALVEAVNGKGGRS